ncbi:MAG: DNA-directed polymerase subunit alpha [Patescibacteria group bacterium]|jgi:DNA-directed RNA polymerase alpha subunit|nr:DNA-directed polymerase subunit alpha [Patescibacteria group bacterium]
MKVTVRKSGLIEVTFSAEEVIERLLPTVCGEEKEMILMENTDLVFYIRGITAQDLMRLQKEAEYRSGPLWDRLLAGEDLTTRTRSVLESADIDTFGKLVSVNRIKLLKYRNVGKKTLSEIDDLLYKHGLEFIG